MFIPEFVLGGLMWLALMAGMTFAIPIWLSISEARKDRKKEIHNFISKGVLEFEAKTTIRIKLPDSIVDDLIEKYEGKTLLDKAKNVVLVWPWEFVDLEVSEEEIANTKPDKRVIYWESYGVLAQSGEKRRDCSRRLRERVCLGPPKKWADDNLAQAEDTLEEEVDRRVEEEQPKKNTWRPF